MKPKRTIKQEPTSADPETLLDLIKTLRGSYKGPGSLLKDRERDHKRDERIKNRKFAAMIFSLARTSNEDDAKP